MQSDITNLFCLGGAICTGLTPSTLRPSNRFRKTKKNDLFFSGYTVFSRVLLCSYKRMSQLASSPTFVVCKDSSPSRSNACWPASSGGLQSRAWVCSTQSALKASLTVDLQHQLAKKQSTQNHVDAFGRSGFISTNSRNTKANHYFFKCPACFDWSIHFCSI